jgi:hypothetical protein
MKRRWMLVSAMLLIVVIAIAILYADNRSERVERADPEAFKRGLAAAADGKDWIDLAGVAEFEWDLVHVFGPYTSWEEMERAVGTRWSTGSLADDLLRRTSIGRYPLDNESMQKLVFLKENAVVLDVTLMRRDLDFTSVVGKHERATAMFFIDRTKEYPTAVRDQVRK